jgi:hypothetical protein
MSTEVEIVVGLVPE